MTAERNATRDEAPPPGWRQRLERTADIDAALVELGLSHHFHALALRGRARSLRLEFAEATRNFEESAARFHARPERRPADAGLGYERDLDHFEHLLLEEAAGVANSDLVRVRRRIGKRMFEEEGASEHPYGTRWLTLLATQRISQGDAGSAADVLSLVLAGSEGLPASHPLVIETRIGAAEADMQQNDVNEAQEHLEAAKEGFAKLQAVLHRGILAARLHVLAVSWERDDEAKRWLATLELLDCPAASRVLFAKRAHLLADTVRTSGRVYLV